MTKYKPEADPAVANLGPPVRKRATKVPDPVYKPTEFQFRDHNRDTKRVWLSTWPGDMFTLIDNPSFKRFELMLRRFSIPMVDMNGDD